MTDKTIQGMTKQGNTRKYRAEPEITIHYIPTDTPRQTGRPTQTYRQKYIQIHMDKNIRQTGNCREDRHCD